MTAPVEGDFREHRATRTHCHRNRRRWPEIPVRVGCLVGALLRRGGLRGTVHARRMVCRLKKPSWNPPGWIFAPVWIALYILMAVAAWLTWKRGGFVGQRPALLLFLLQLFFNALWSWLFFGRHQPALAFVDILLLWLCLLATTVAFWKVNVVAGLLLVPYLLWASFAAGLNFALWRLNL